VSPGNKSADQGELAMNAMLRSAVLVGAILAVLAFPARAEKLLKLNESLGPGSPEEFALLHFKKLVEEGSKGEVKIAIHLQDALGKPTQALESLTIGALDLYSGALEYYAPIVGEEINAISLPYLVTSHDHLRAYLKSPVFKKAEEKLLARGIRVLSTEWNADRGPYRVLVSSKPVLNADDLKGLKVRMFPNEVYVRSWKQLQTVPIQLAWTETYLGIRQGVVNAVTAPLSLVRSMKFTEVAPFIVEIREYPQTWPITISERSWKKLSADEQQLLVRAANEAGKVYARTTMDRAESDVAAMIRDNNAVVIRLNTDAMRAKMLPLYADLIKEKALSQELFDTVNALPR
jgi:TRAP-type C4-dicarboxylate transport system substrate-binding protein